MSTFNSNKHFDDIVNHISYLQKAIESGVKLDLIKNIKFNRDRIKETAKILNGKWAADILWTISYLHNPFFNEIKNTLPEVNIKSLTNTLKSFEKKEIIERRVHDQQPIRVSYCLTEFGKGLFSLSFSIAIYIALKRKKLKKKEFKR